ncbi:hypothetical protein [Plantactinospora sp. KBS50]|uniref:hypothetical protein n=1 Tax=Plantactinospora sp. KBS50 TaxID=2024580 RepID=UPI000BAB0C30|nr:hypothetical protein [Plantactinospora sp. KBS50]ASW53047.1 hypothetical protein CIK06_00855 [Plantactinospora sp. KBS50]
MSVEQKPTQLHLILGFGLLLAGLGVLVQYLVGVPGFPTIPPGPIILGIGGILVLAMGGRARWILIVGLIVAAFVMGGGLIEGSMWGRLGTPSEFGPWIGAVMQWAGLLIAFVTAIVALVRVYGGSRTPAVG